MCSFTTTWDSAVRRPGICGTAIISLWPPVCTSTIWRRRAVRRRLGGSPSSTSRLEENRHDEVFGLWTGCDRAGDGSGHAGGCADQYPHRQHRLRRHVRGIPAAGRRGPWRGAGRRLRRPRHRRNRAVLQPRRAGATPPTRGDGLHLRLRGGHALLVAGPGLSTRGGVRAIGLSAGTFGFSNQPEYTVDQPDGTGRTYAVAETFLAGTYAQNF